MKKFSPATFPIRRQSFGGAWPCFPLALGVECVALKVLTVCLFLAPLLLAAQQPTILAPGAAALAMVPQPPVIVAESENITATAMFDPPRVHVGEKTFYRVTIEATQNEIIWPDTISAPVELKFGAGVRGQISRLMANQFHPLTSFVYEAVPTAAGRLVVSNFIVPVGWRPVEIPAATLEVVANNSVPAAPARRLRLVVSETNLFFGQPFRLRLLLPAQNGNQIEALREVQFNGNGFMTDKLATRQLVENVNHDGQQKPAFIYETVATPMAVGPLTVSAQAFTAGREFSGPVTMIGQMILGGEPPQYVLLTAEALKLNVRPLPTEGELPGFTGALGKFIADPPQLSAHRARVGEPLHLQFSFHAGGNPLQNLNRFVPPEVPRSRDWQIIADSSPGSGFTLIPQTDEATNTPTIPFCAFDPATKSFYDLTIPALPVSVANEGLPVQIAAGSGDETKAAPLKLSALATTTGRSVDRLKPLQMQGKFVFLQFLPLIGLLALWRWDERRRFLEAHPEIVRRRKAKRDLRREKIKLQAAAAAHDAEKFVAHSAAAMRIAVAPHFPANERALVGGDILTQFSAAEREGHEGETVRKIFAAADAQFRGAGRLPVTSSLDWKPGGETPAPLSDVEKVLQKLEEKL